VKEMEKSIEEQIYLKEGKRIPQETSRIAGGEPCRRESPLVTREVLGKKKGRKKDEGAWEALI
jgi:hypothetical protein